MNGEILHDYFGVRGGGERLVLTLAAGLGWPITCGYAAPFEQFRTEFPDVRMKDLGVRPGAPGLRTLRLVRRWRGYRPHASIALYSGTYAPMAAVNRTAERNILYCHTPPRFVYDQREFYLGLATGWRRPALHMLIRHVRRNYERALHGIDSIVVNSRNVQRRVEEYLGRTSVVVYPPCDTDRHYWREPEGFYLSTARLDILKRVDRVVRAFKMMPEKRLVVVSGGGQRNELESIADGATNISFIGEVDDNCLRDLLSRCIATIYIPRNEDFGMSPVESMAAGKPVIGVAEGGLLETVVGGETGLLVPADPAVEDLVDAVHALGSERARAMRSACEQRAALFDTTRFLDGIRAVLSDTRGNSSNGDSAR